MGQVLEWLKTVPGHSEEQPGRSALPAVALEASLQPYP